MAERSYPFVDGATTDAEFSTMFDQIIGSGVRYGSAGEDLTVTADSSGLNVKVQPGVGFVRGTFYKNDAIKTLTIAAGNSNPRIDAIVLRLAYGTTNSITLAVIQGTPAVNPAAPTIASSDTGTTEFLLAHINVPASAATINSGNVVDKRIMLGSYNHFWTTSARPTRPGSIGFNTTTGKVEKTDNGSVWKDVVGYGDSITAAMLSSSEQLLLNVGRVNGSKMSVQETAPANPQVNDLHFF